MNSRTWARFAWLTAFIFSFTSGCSEKPAAPPTDFSKEKSVNALFGKTTSLFGVTQVHLQGDGATTPSKIGGKECQRLQPKAGRSDCYLYFQIDPAFKTTRPMNLKVVVEYFDATPVELDVQYDGEEGPYTPTEENIQLTGDQQWKTAEFTIRKALLTGRQNSGADCRVRSFGGECFVRSVNIARELE